MCGQQFGFSKHHSTSHAINYSVNLILDGIQSQKHVLGIFIDLSKAFDTINHGILLEKLCRCGIRGNCLELLKDNLTFHLTRCIPRAQNRALVRANLTSRNQLVKCNGEKSNLGTIEFGVPQGSVLDPLIFLIYSNDIINCSKTSRFVLFADDTNIFISANNESEAYEIANKTLEDLQHYILSNQLHINISKCTYMHFRPDFNNEERQISARTLPHSYHLKHKLFIRGVNIYKVDKVRFLGIIIDDRLKWDAHISHLETRLLSSI